jgi:hypothetical protein
VFKKRNASTLPKHRPYDYTIDLVERTQPPFGPIYTLSQDELATPCEYLNENFEKRFIRHSKSPTNALIFFIKRKGDFCEYVLIIVD